jgi:hypothetical protein
VRGRQLADRVAGHHRRGHPPRLQQPEQGDLDREQAGLGPDRPVQEAVLVTVAPDDRPQVATGLIEVLLQPCTDGVEGPGEHGMGRVEALPHVHPLRALTGEHESDLAQGSGRAGHHRHRRRLLTGRQPVQPGQQFLPVGADHHGPLGQRRPRRGEGPTDVARIEVRPRTGELPQPLRLRGQPRRAAGREHPGDDRRLLSRIGVVEDRLLGGLLKDDVGVGAGEAERRDPGPARAAGLRPFCRLGHQLDRARLPVDV